MRLVSHLVSAHSTVHFVEHISVQRQPIFRRSVHESIVIKMDEYIKLGGIVSRMQ